MATRNNTKNGVTLIKEIVFIRSISSGGVGHKSTKRAHQSIRVH